MHAERLAALFIKEPPSQSSFPLVLGSALKLFASADKSEHSRLVDAQSPFRPPSKVQLYKFDMLPRDSSQVIVIDLYRGKICGTLNLPESVDGSVMAYDPQAKEILLSA